MATPGHRANGLQFSRQAASTITGTNDGLYDDSNGNLKYVIAGNAFNLFPATRVSTTGGLTSGLAGQMLVDGQARVTSTKQIFITEDGVNWVAYS